MNNDKQEVMEVIKNLPEDTTWDEAIHALYKYSCLRENQEDVEND